MRSEWKIKINDEDFFFYEETMQHNESTISSIVVK